MQKTNPNTSSIDLSALSDGVGEANELHPKDKARLVMAYVVLGGVVGLFVLSWLALLVTSAERLERAQQIFDFTKSFGPPLVTLVLGFYFREAVEP